MRSGSEPLPVIREDHCCLLGRAHAFPPLEGITGELNSNTLLEANSKAGTLNHRVLPVAQELGDDPSFHILVHSFLNVLKDI